MVIIVIVVLSLTLIYSLVVFDIMVRYALEARKTKRDLEMLKNELNHLLSFEKNLAINRITTYNVPPPNKMPNNHCQNALGKSGIVPAIIAPQSMSNRIEARIFKALFAPILRQILRYKITHCQPNQNKVYK